MHEREAGAVIIGYCFFTTFLRTGFVFATGVTDLTVADLLIEDRFLVCETLRGF